jgi:tRNA threonylcarbamoyladenosine biosynthesis protein TsaE
MDNFSLNDVPVIAKELLKNITGKVLLFYGEMGSGKTTLIKEIVKQMDVDDVVSSPTFSLVNEYHSKKGEKIYHFDFYRIEDEEEAYDMGIEEYLYSDNWCLIEWPEKVENLLPLDSVEIHLNIKDKDTRTIQIK